MSKKKIIFIILGVMVFCLALVLGYTILNNKNDKKDNSVSIDDKVESVITLDINPSIKLEINKDKQVINMISLNEDGKDIIINNYKGKNFEVIIDNITDKLIDKGYAKDELIILVGVKGKILEEEVKKVFDNKLENKDIKYNIIIPEVSESSSLIAKKYNITDSKASYLEDILEKYIDLKIEDLKDMSIKDIITKTEEIDKSLNNDNQENGNSYGGGYGTLEKCNYVSRALTNEEAGKKVASLMGASVGTGKYCDKLAPESVADLSADGTCVYKVTFAHRTRSCVYYVGVETGNIIGEPSCTSKLVDEGEAQCIVMESMGITKREQAYLKNNRDNGSEWIYDVEDVYGTPDEEGKRYIYEYHVSKYTGEITSKTAIGELH